MLTSNEPALRGLVRAALMEPFRPRSAQPDETIADFVNRRLGARICDNLVSAVIHGIYAGDVHQLSARSTINFLWEMERKHGSIAGGIAAAAFSALSSSSASAAPDPVAADLMSQIAADPACKQFVDGIQKNASIYSFTNGMQVLTDTLIDRLRADNVEVIQTASVGIRQQSAEPTSHLEVALANGRILLADHVVSAVPASTLSRLLPASRITPLLAHNPAATVAVVNLVYRGDLLPLQGFGYLVPRSERHSTDIIGCIFDSCTLPNQASPAGYTRLTVMMGGPTATFCERFGDPASVDPDVLQQKAVGAVAAHLGIAPTALATSRVSVLRDCIPHYAVGHADRVASVEAFIEQTMPGRLSLVGSSYRGVGVNDCVHTARAAAFHLFGKNAHVLA
nr:hypothetical protein HK105_003018 [Polyrhizophydium stewartii]